jgi:hypothetical protein
MTGNGHWHEVVDHVGRIGTAKQMSAQAQTTGPLLAPTSELDEHTLNSDQSRGRRIGPSPLRKSRTADAGSESRSQRPARAGDCM